MTPRPVQLVVHYDGAGFAGWQVQPGQRTVQGVIEAAMERLTQAPMRVQGAGRTDAGVHARGQAVGVKVAERWTPAELRRALNAILPYDVWIAAAFEMKPEFHARYSATARRYTYHIATGPDAASPFRRRWSWDVQRDLDLAALQHGARTIVGEHAFFAFAVRNTAPATDDHRCVVADATWTATADGFVFDVTANRFLHHMVRFLVGTMVDVASGRRPADDIARLLAAATNDDVSPPAPAHALFLEQVTYPRDLYLAPA
jgi:tRNA pseudouridine38-40 synthase